MKGILLKTEQGWSVKYTEKDKTHVLKTHSDNKKYLSMLPGDEFHEVEFSITTEYMEPDSSIHCNRGDDVTVARILEPSENTWNEIMVILSNPDVAWGTKEAMIRERYNPPTKKTI